MADNGTVKSEKRFDKNGKNNHKSGDKNVSGKNRRGSYKFIITFSVLILLAGIYYIGLVKNVTVEGNNPSVYSDQEIIDAGGLGEGKFAVNMFAEKKISENLPEIKSVSVKGIKNKTVTVNYNIPILAVENGGKYVFVGSDYKIMDAGSNTDISKITVLTGAEINSSAIGSRISFVRTGYLGMIKNIISSAQKYGNLKLNSINLKNISRITLKINDIYTVIFGSYENTEEKFSKIDKTIKSLKGNSSEYIIDASLYPTVIYRPYSIPEESSEEESTEAYEHDYDDENINYDDYYYQNEN